MIKQYSKSLFKNVVYPFLAYFQDTLAYFQDISKTPALNGQQLLTTEEREQTLFALIVQCC